MVERGWTGLDRVGQGWTGLDRVGRGWTGLDGTGPAYDLIVNLFKVNLELRDRVWPCSAIACLFFCILEFLHFVMFVFCFFIFCRVRILFEINS